MKRKTPLFFLTLFCVIFADLQAAGGRLDQAFSLPPFVLRIYQYPSDDTTKTVVEVNVGIVNDALQFVKLDDNRFKAGYELTLDFLDKDGNHIAGRVSNKEFYAKTYNETNSRQKLNKDKIQFMLPPGEYSLHLDMMDLDTRKHLKREEDITVNDFSGPEIKLGSLVFLEYKSSDVDDLDYNLAKVYVHADKTIFVRFSAANVSVNDSLRIGYALKDWNGKVLRTWDEWLKPERRTLTLTRSLTEFIPESGQYTFEVTCEQAGQKVSSSDYFSVKFRPKSAWGDENDAMASMSIYGPLKYITRGREFEKIANADSLTRIQLIEEFWKKRDPSPGTEVNELKDEFYTRIAFANRQFSVLATKKVGWDTDRGKIYIKFGHPDLVRTQSREIGEAPMEIWIYKDIDKRFVFRDKRGHGDYELIYQE